MTPTQIKALWLAITLSLIALAPKGYGEVSEVEASGVEVREAEWSGEQNKSDNGEPTPIIIKHAPRGWTSDLQAYQNDLITLIFNQSLVSHGAFRLEMENRDLTNPRLNTLLRQGKIDSIFFSNRNAANNLIINNTGAALYPKPYLKALLGLRRFIIRREDIEKFSKIKTLRNLQNFTAGQPEGWPDSLIYENHDIKVVRPKSYSRLFLMLKNKRFDFIPLSTLEIDKAHREIAQQYPDLVILKGIFVYYPLPVVVAITGQRPKLQSRMDIGLNKIFDQAPNKTFDELFLKHFPLSNDSRASDKSVIIFLENPDLSADKNFKITHYFKEEYLSEEKTENNR
ncbi:MAG: hypothetical protein ACI93R_004160 [Flavobacteriales bacterium]|jgi:hypothetical protein